jgi:hypothetical protein
MAASYVPTQEISYIGPLRNCQNATSGLGATAGAAALSHESRAIIVHGTAGSLKVTFADRATAVVIPAVTANTIYPFCVTHIYTVTGGSTKIYAYW